MIGISPDGAESHKKFRTKNNLPFILLSDPDHKVAEKYGAWGEKTTFGVKSVGIIRSHFVIDEHGKLIGVQMHVKAKESATIAMQSLG